jgi:transposase-like protein
MTLFSISVTKTRPLTQAVLTIIFHYKVYLPLCNPDELGRSTTCRYVLHDLALSALRRSVGLTWADAQAITFRAFGAGIRSLTQTQSLAILEASVLANALLLRTSVARKQPNLWLTFR